MLLFEVLFKPRRFVNFDSYVLPKGKSEEGKEEKEGKERKGIGREKREARGVRTRERERKGKGRKGSWKEGDQTQRETDQDSSPCPPCIPPGRLYAPATTYWKGLELQMVTAGKYMALKPRERETLTSQLR